MASTAVMKNMEMEKQECTFSQKLTTSCSNTFSMKKINKKMLTVLELIVFLQSRFYGI